MAGPLAGLALRRVGTSAARYEVRRGDRRNRLLHRLIREVLLDEESARGQSARDRAEQERLAAARRRRVQIRRLERAVNRMTGTLMPWRTVVARDGKHRLQSVRRGRLLRVLLEQLPAEGPTTNIRLLLNAITGVAEGYRELSRGLQRLEDAKLGPIAMDVQITCFGDVIYREQWKRSQSAVRRPKRRIIGSVRITRGRTRTRATISSFRGYRRRDPQQGGALKQALIGMQ